MSWSYYTDGDCLYADGNCYQLRHGTMAYCGLCPPENIRRLCQDGREAWREGSSMTEEKKAWYEGIPAPVDADGNVVPLTTQVMFGRRGDAYSMDRFSFDMGTKSWIAYFERRGSSDSTEVSNLRLKRPLVQGLSQPDSWDRLLGDLDRAAGRACPTCHYACGRMTQCRSCRFHKIPSGGCEGAVLSEIARRIRNLMGEER